MGEEKSVKLYLDDSAFYFFSLPPLSPSLPLARTHARARACMICNAWYGGMPALD